ncbi:MAG: hypothetical protein JO057_05420 [Chloroflexi bacterium]|nr:hypothetical protein [Chloroflexota bacterium]
MSPPRSSTFMAVFRDSAQSRAFEARLRDNDFFDESAWIRATNHDDLFSQLNHLDNAEYPTEDAQQLLRSVPRSSTGRGRSFCCTAQHDCTRS